MALQVGILKRHGGDVDKMIGDVVLARFDGEDGGARAVTAARDIQQAAAEGDFAREIGIGIYNGAVISGAIGPVDHRDLTVIGDAVNTASRLCSAAAAGEIVVDEAWPTGTSARRNSSAPRAGKVPSWSAGSGPCPADKFSPRCLTAATI